MTEEYFPRGGKKPSVTYFKQNSNFLGAVEKGQGKKKKQKKKSENDDGYLSDEAVQEVDQSYRLCAAGIGFKTIKPGVNLLGRVVRVLESKLRISMPNKMQGHIMACHISQPYTKMLEAYVNDETEKVCELHEMFSPGQYVAVHVLEADGTSEGIMLSAMPQHLYSGVTHSDLQKGDILQAAVVSVEDHGYSMDTGVANVRAFLPKSEVDPEIGLDTGSLTWTSVKSVTKSADNSIVTLSASQAALQKALRRKPGSSALLPGAAVEFTVDKPLDNGIEGRVLDTTAYIQRFHADRVKGKKPALGQKIKAHVLYVMPTRKAPFLTMRNIFESPRPDLEAEMKFKVGDVIDEAQVLKIAGRSIHFKLGRRCTGTMSLRRVAVDEDLSDEQVIAQSYPIGSTHRVRVLAYNPSDYIYHVTDQAALLTEKYFTYSQLSAGDLVQGNITEVADNHVRVAVGRLSGYVSQLHLSDAGVYVDPKKATTSKLTKKKYKVGQQVEARVLSVDAAKEMLQLSLKPSLLARDVSLLSSYQAAEVGKAYTGVIKVVKDYVLVSFLSDVQAYVPRKMVSRDPVASLSEAFHPGQVVGCTVIRVDPDSKKLLGSLITAPFIPGKQNEEQDAGDIEMPTKKRKTSESDVKDTVKKKKDKKDKKKKSQEASEESPETADVDTKKKKKDKKKKTDVSEESDATDQDNVESQMKSKQPLASYEEAEIGKAYTGVIKVVKDYILVKFLGDIHAYVPRKMATREPVDSLNEVFQPGQQVSCTVLQVHPRDKRMLGSLTIAPFWPKKQSEGHHNKSDQDTSDIDKSTNKRNTSESDETDTVKKKKDKKKKGQEVSEESTEKKKKDKREENDEIHKQDELMKANQPLESYEQAEVGKAYTGVIKVVKDYVLVRFLGDVHAYVPRNMVTREPVDSLDEAVQPGDLVSCTVLQVHPEDNRMLGSLTIEPFWPAKHHEGHREKRKQDTDDSEIPKKKRKKDKKEVSEESDAIETDIHEDSDQILRPEDLALIDISNCETAKQWKKRLVSLKKSINSILNRIKIIDKKIQNLEEKGLTASNKKFHTAMHQEKLVIEERISKFKKAMKKVHAKLKEFDEEDFTDDDDTEEETDNKNTVEEKVKKNKKGVVVDKSKEIKVVESLEPALEVPSAKEFWAESDNVAKNIAEESSSSSEDEETEQPKKKRKKLTAAEKVAKARAEEERLRDLERRAAESEGQPRSSDQFERALLANPNCSQLWIAYMAFHLQATEIDKARAVGRKALNTISFREEQDKLNVWLAMLNFENRFGTKESQQKTLEEALQMNDTFKVHSKLLDIYCETSKSQELSSLVDLMLRKYKRAPDTYVQCGAACFRLGLLDKARHVMQKAISVLEKKEHVQVLVQFALQERAHGSLERAEALFEQVLAVYPQRVDVCAVYVDMLAKGGDVDAVRQVMERMTSQKLPARKVKALYNKWVEIEERAGDAERADQVRERALQFMNNAKF